MKESKDLISIIIPSYNRADNLPDCLDTILNQTYSNLEVIVIDNNSKDNTEEVVLKYAEKDSRVRYLKETKQGVSHARNKGLDNVSKDSEYIMFVDSDDVIDLEICKKLHDAATKFDVDLAIALYKREFKNREKEIEKVEYANREMSGEELKKHFLELFDKWLITVSFAKLYRTKKMMDQNVRFRGDMVIFEDKIFNFDYIDENTTWTVVNEYLYTYIHNSESITTTFKPSRIEDTQLALDRSLKILESKNFSNKEVVNRMITEYGQSCFLLVDNILGDNKLKKEDRKKYIKEIIDKHNHKLKEEYKDMIEKNDVKFNIYNKVILTGLVTIVKTLSHMRRIAKKIHRG